MLMGRSRILLLCVLAMLASSVPARSAVFITRCDFLESAAPGLRVFRVDLPGGGGSPHAAFSWRNPGFVFGPDGYYFIGGVQMFNARTRALVYDAIYGEDGSNPTIVVEAAGRTYVREQPPYTVFPWGGWFTAGGYEQVDPGSYYVVAYAFGSIQDFNGYFDIAGGSGCVELTPAATHHFYDQYSFHTVGSDPLASQHVSAYGVGTGGGNGFRPGGNLIHSFTTNNNFFVGVIACGAAGGAMLLHYYPPTAPGRSACLSNSFAVPFVWGPGTSRYDLSYTGRSFLEIEGWDLDLPLL